MALSPLDKAFVWQHQHEQVVENQRGKLLSLTQAAINAVRPRVAALPSTSGTLQQQQVPYHPTHHADTGEVDGVLSKLRDRVTKLEADARRQLPPPSPPPPPPPSSSNTANPNPTDNDDIAAALTRRNSHNQHISSPQAQRFTKVTLCNRVRLHMNSLTETQRDVLKRVDGVKDDYGPRGLFQFISSLATPPISLETVMHVVAAGIVQVACSRANPERVKRGETSFALCYVVLLTCVRFPSFAEAFRAALDTACPFITPSLYQHLEQMIITDQTSKKTMSPSKCRKLLGYLDDNESDDDYVIRMQAATAFWGALLQTKMTMLGQLFDPEATSLTQHPFGGLIEAWRWLAATTNSKKSRWIRYVTHSFLVSGAGYELSLVAKAQMNKLLRLWASPEYEKQCDSHGTKHPQDDDRITVFHVFVKDAMTKHGIAPPGRPVESSTDDDTMEFVDPRILPLDASQNQG